MRHEVERFSLGDEDVSASARGTVRVCYDPTSLFCMFCSDACGYSVAGGIPGGLIAEYVMQNAGKVAVAELSPLLGPVASKTFVGFALFSVMGVFLEFCAISPPTRTLTK